MNVDDAIADLRQFARRHNLAPATFARRSKLAPNTLRNFWSDDWSPRADTLRALAAYRDRFLAEFDAEDAA